MGCIGTRGPDCAAANEMTDVSVLLPEACIMVSFRLELAYVFGLTARAFNSIME